MPVVVFEVLLPGIERSFLLWRLRLNDLTETEINALREALDDEYRPWAAYDQVIADDGEVLPFINICAAEACHIDALLKLFTRYDLLVSENAWPGKVERYESLQEACQAGVAAEIDNGEMHGWLFAATWRPDILTVLRNLQEASQQRHLPAFQRCVERSAGSGYSGRRHCSGRRQV